MLTNPTSCKWYDHDGEPVAANASHYMVDKPHPNHPAVLVVARRHVESPFELKAEEWADLGEMLDQPRTWLAQHEPEDFTIGWNVGVAGGQHVFHAHMHVICRFAGEVPAERGLRDFILR
ncbi:Putative Cell-cycle regulation histidine triad HIT protein (plasmid) [Neorhizobium galegae bv. officinalis bv. officinalis str. HAMBI 1141]|jgi:diadenosine tetraphosphate (Ap4A) HIT family hydrolase|uniref:Putative Cell-cycle regulation histidine triad HIT protein n=1 Tax=Neorhizobium galegae bv. officinalis bv. officinalis str. HAMBI 1141 TaxID=1028801 RepID=A0A068TIT6_NEOGA|nr:HIT domain-containing protein [Neorhizobium galegae]CDN58352.1 Putative Cell-cycle regulation histidine triad HIT protein [Neorhizobium galegae bv. officinalis bv. officinalis str. HAMBI 1141]